MALGGVRDEAEIRGHRRTYIGSLPGKILRRWPRRACEIRSFSSTKSDKMGMDVRGILPRRCSRCSTRSRTRVSTITISSGLRPVGRLLRLHVQFDEHPCATARPDGSHTIAGVHGRREGQHRAQVPRAEAIGTGRARRHRPRDRRRVDTPPRPLYTREGWRFAGSSAKSPKSCRKLVKGSRPRARSGEAGDRSRCNRGVQRRSQVHVRTRGGEEPGRRGDGPCMDRGRR